MSIHFNLDNYLMSLMNKHLSIKNISELVSDAISVMLINNTNSGFINFILTLIDKYYPNQIFIINISNYHCDRMTTNSLNHKILKNVKFIDKLISKEPTNVIDYINNNKDICSTVLHKNITNNTNTLLILNNEYIINVSIGHMINIGLDVCANISIVFTISNIGLEFKIIVCKFTIFCKIVLHSYNN